jgi:hypothetical protein
MGEGFEVFLKGVIMGLEWSDFLSLANGVWTFDGI